MRSSANTSFFSVLGALPGRQQRESQLSRAFQACFNHSRGFRAVVLQVLHRHCYLRFGPGDLDDWEADVEVATRDKQGRLDIHLRPSAAETFGSRGAICIENKVNAPASLDQLRRYRKQKMGVVVLVTKNRPETGEPLLRKHRISHFRWQDLHDALQSASGVRGKDAFILAQFCRHLEELDMAYEKTISRTEIKEMARVFQKIERGTKGVVVPGRGLDVARRWVKMAGELAARLREEVPALKNANLRGPVYYCMDFDDVRHQAISISFSTRPRSQEHQFECGLMWCENEDPWLNVWYANGDPEGNRWEPVPLSQVSKKNQLDADSIAERCIQLARDWKITLK